MYLILNVGSTSFKYALFNQDLSEHSRGSLENFEALLKELGPEFKPTALGHRIVHGGTKFLKPTVINSAVLTELERVSNLAPLHNQPALEVVKRCMDTWEGVSNLACFDTSFYKNLPLFAKLYALPYEFYEKYGIQRFGFHGLSHQHAADEAARQLGKNLDSLKLITCHLGGGCSITAIEDGQPIDTSMGFTPLEGLIMTSRAGDIDPGILIYLQREHGLDIEKVEALLLHQSGLLGISGISSDTRELLAESSREGGNSARAGLALQMYAYRIKKYIGSYFVALGGLDALVFTGAVGVGGGFVREMVTNGLEVLGNFEVLTIKTNEEIVIAKNLLNLR